MCIRDSYSISLWERQIELIRQRHGLIGFIVHPDYIIEEPARECYRELLQHLSGLISANQVWMAAAGDVNRWWRERSQMQLIRQGNGWRISGPGSERARLAYAFLQDGKLAYSLEHERGGVVAGGKSGMDSGSPGAAPGPR